MKHSQLMKHTTQTKFHLLKTVHICLPVRSAPPPALLPAQLLRPPYPYLFPLCRFPLSPHCRHFYLHLSRTSRVLVSLLLPLVRPTASSAHDSSAACLSRPPDSADGSSASSSSSARLLAGLSHPPVHPPASFTSSLTSLLRLSGRPRAVLLQLHRPQGTCWWRATVPSAGRSAVVAPCKAVTSRGESSLPSIGRPTPVPLQTGFPHWLRDETLSHIAAARRRGRKVAEESLCAVCWPPCCSWITRWLGRATTPPPPGHITPSRGREFAGESLHDVRGPHCPRPVVTGSRRGNGQPPHGMQNTMSPPHR